VVEGNSITWRFTDLEPTVEDNIYLNVLEPQRYERLLKARSKVKQGRDGAPTKLAAGYLELARAAREAVLIIKDVTSNGGGKALGEEASAAYERALELNPDDASIYSEYARWVLSKGGWRELEFEGKCPEKACGLVQRGLEKFPQDADLLELDTLFKDSLRMHQTEIAYATQDALATAAKAQATHSAVPTKTAAPSRTPLRASATVTPSATPTKVAPSATAQPSVEAPSPPAPAAGGGACPSGLLPITVMAALGACGRVRLLNRRRGIAR
jgi:hypothetical protein